MSISEFVATIDHTAGWFLTSAGTIRCPSRHQHWCCPVTQRYDLSPMMAPTCAASLEMTEEDIEAVMLAADNRVDETRDLVTLRNQLLEACGLAR